MDLDNEPNRNGSDMIERVRAGTGCVCDLPTNKARVRDGDASLGRFNLTAATAGHRAFVAADDLLAGAVHLNLSTLDPKGPLTKAPNRSHLVRYKDDGAAVAGHIRHLA